MVDAVQSSWSAYRCLGRVCDGRVEFVPMLQEARQGLPAPSGVCAVYGDHLRNLLLISSVE